MKIRCFNYVKTLVTPLLGRPASAYVVHVSHVHAHTHVRPFVGSKFRVRAEGKDVPRRACAVINPPDLRTERITSRCTPYVNRILDVHAPEH